MHIKKKSKLSLTLSRSKFIQNYSQIDRIYEISHKHYSTWLIFWKKIVNLNKPLHDISIHGTNEKCHCTKYNSYMIFQPNIKKEIMAIYDRDVVKILIRIREKKFIAQSFLAQVI